HRPVMTAVPRTTVAHRRVYRVARYARLVPVPLANVGVERGLRLGYPIPARLELEQRRLPLPLLLPRLPLRTFRRLQLRPRLRTLRPARTLHALKRYEEPATAHACLGLQRLFENGVHNSGSHNG